MNKYFLTTHVKNASIVDGCHDNRLCKIFREDEQFFYAKALIRDAFIRLPKIDSVSGQQEQHCHFIDTLETSDEYKELTFEKANFDSFNRFKNYRLIDIPNNNVSSVYFIDDEMIKNYKLSFLHLNIGLYKHFHKIGQVNFRIEKNKKIVFESEQKKEDINRRVNVLYNIQCDENRLIVLESLINNITIEPFIEPSAPKPKPVIKQAIYPTPVIKKQYVKKAYVRPELNFDSDSD
jgi:hypothetical protein